MMEYTTIESTQGICPTGWHIPSDDEWKVLDIELGMSPAAANATGYRGVDEGSQLAGDKLSWNDGALDQNEKFGSSGFNAVPAGYYYPLSNNFNYQFYRNFLWSSTEAGAVGAMNRGLEYNFLNFTRNNFTKTIGISVRCLKD